MISATTWPAWVLGEHREERPGALLLASAVALPGAHERRRHEVALRRGGLHDEARAEQLADQRLEDHRGGEELLGPVAAARDLLDRLARLLPDRIALEDVLVRAAVEALDLFGELEVVEDEVLREAQLVDRADRERVVEHVRRGVALRRRVDVQAEAVLDVGPRADVALDDRHPGAAPARVGAGRLGVGQRLADLPHGVRRVAEDRHVPLLVRVTELVPVRGLQGRPLLGVARGAVGEGVDPSLRQVPLRIGLDVDGDVLVDRGAALGRLEVVVGAAARRGELLRTSLGVREVGDRDAALLGCRLLDGVLGHVVLLSPSSW